MRRFCDDPYRMICVQPARGHVVASLDKALYDDHLCLVASNKQQIYVERSQPENLENGELLSA